LVALVYQRKETKMSQKTNTKPVKPYIETFFGVPMKGYCGNPDCERMIWTGWERPTLDQIKERVKVCPHCGTPIDWD